MARWIACCVVIGGLVLFGRADEADAKKKKSTEGEQALASLMKDLRDEITASRGDTARRKKMIASSSRKLLEHARKYPDDTSAVEALIAVLRFNRPPENKARGEALELLKKQYVKSKLIARHLRGLIGAGEDAQAVGIVQAVYKDNADRVVRALAARALANGLERKAQIGQAIENDARERSLFERTLGKVAVQKMIDDVPTLKKQAREYRDALKADLKGALPDLSIGAAAPPTTGQDLDEETVDLADYKGKVVVLDFWATWCEPCRRMLPHTQELVKEMKDKPFAFISISVDEKKDSVTAFQKKARMPWIHWWDGKGGKLAELWDVSVFPTIYVIDDKGTIRYRQVGYRAENDRLEKAIRKLVEAVAGQKKAKDE
jgi:thiol-disulfide isomerase/thioredoxin